MLQKDYALFLVGLAITLLIAVWLDKKYSALHKLSLECCNNGGISRISSATETGTRTITSEFNL